MKKIIYALTCALGVMSFTSSENLINDANEDFCNLTFEIEGGGNCIYNGSYSGWCSEAEFNGFANNVYATEDCSRPRIQHI